jgi:hypothetical protein
MKEENVPSFFQAGSAQTQSFPLSARRRTLYRISMHPNTWVVTIVKLYIA